MRGRKGFPSRPWRRRKVFAENLNEEIGWPQRDSNPRLGLERASPWLVISRTSTPDATARCHCYSLDDLQPVHQIAGDHESSVRVLNGRDPQRHAEDQSAIHGWMGQSMTLDGMKALRLRPRRKRASSTKV